jgi:UPF0755 protein
MSDHEKQEQKNPPKKRRFIRRILLVLLLLVLLTAVAAVLGAIAVYQHVTQPGVPGQPVAITVPEGANGRDVGDILVANRLIEHELLFRLAVKFDETRRPIRFGLYSIPAGLSSLEILHILQDGPNRAPTLVEIPPELRPTIPEGLSLQQAAALFQNPGDFLNAAMDPVLVAKAGIDAPTLEGFLMPETYFFDKKPSEREVVERMVNLFEQKYSALTAESPPPEGFDKLEIITIASLVEEEARVPEERPKVASVIYNRLKRKMPLQLDSTLQYALNKYGQRLLYEDREIDSPYNTYKHAGLPPGPISSPGIASIKAALNPEQADYLYFVSNADGLTHTFTDTITDHVRAVNKFRREIAPQRKEERQKETKSPKKAPAR